MALTGGARDKYGAEGPRESPAFDAARVTHLYRSAVPAYVASPVYVGLLMFVLWDADAAGALVGWFTGMAGVSVARAALHAAFIRSESLDPLAWERRFVLGTLAVGAVWSAAPLLFFPQASTVGKLAIVFVIGGALIGAAGLYSVSRAAFLAFLALPMAASIYSLVVQPGETYRAMGAMLVLFVLLLLLVYAQLRGSVLTALRIRFENEALIGRLGESESRLRDAIESSPDGIAIYDGSDRLVTCNATYASLYAPGEGAGKLVGTPFRVIAEAAFDHAEFIAEESCADREAWVEARVERHNRANGALRQYQTRDGRWLQGKSVRTPLGGVVGVFTDISETKRAEAAYQAVLAEENLVFDILPVGIMFVEQRRIVRCNRRLEQMLGYEPGELVGRATRELYGSDRSWETVGRDAYARLRTEGVVGEDTRFVRKDGTTLWCRSLGRAVDPGDPQASAIFAVSDAQERRAAERALRESEAMYRNLVETSNDLIWSVDLDGRWSYLNGAAVRRIWGSAAEDMLGQPFSDSVVAELRERDQAVFRRILEGEHVQDYETRHLRSDGAHVDLSFNAIALRDPQDRIIGATGTARDVTHARQAAAALYESVERLRLAVDAADLYYWEWSLADDKFSWGREPEGLLGSQVADGRVHSDWRTLVHPDDRERFDAAGRRPVETGEAYYCEFRIVGREGRLRWIAARGKVVYGERGHAERMIGVSQDISDRKRQEEEVRFLAYHDTLTGLPNRRLLDDRLRQAVFAAQRRDARLAVMVIDLDHFKKVNDSMGHKAGDAVLREVANRLAGCVRKADTLARQGGDEFVIVIPDLSLETDCAVVAEKILRSMLPEFRVDGQAFGIGASIGISQFPDDAIDGETLLRNADVAMYRAKELGRNNYRFYGR